MQRPYQTQFDFFSRGFQLLDDDLNEFCQKYGWKLTKNPHRCPGRDLLKYDRMRLIISIALDGDWRNLPYDSDLSYFVAVSGMFQPVSDLYFYRRHIMLQNASFDTIQRELQTILGSASRMADEWVLPYLTEMGYFTIPEGWGVASPDSLRID